MRPKIKTILLIDDSEADNFIHKRVIDKAEVAESVIVSYSGQEALDYITTAVEGAYPLPEIVFLDINMPGMNGWEFLDHYRKLESKFQAGLIMCMLTTSSDERDKLRAKEAGVVADFISKPLTHDILMDILETYYYKTKD